ncbi:MAG: hypothetical protein M8357_11765 [Desulfobulbaceae bacterium]|nr:hypothetical protein [Desulfobulbaceae bacterium]
MLNRAILFVMLSAGILAISAPLKAELVYVDQGVIYETLGDQYWFQDISLFINKNYYEQMDAVSDLGGNWRMANEGDIYNLWLYSSMEIGEAFTPSYTVINTYNSTVSTGWRGRANYIFSDNTLNDFSHATPNIWKENDIWHEKIIFGSYPDTVSEFLGAWVVTDICPLTSLELADSLYRKIEESAISSNIKKSYLNIVRQIIDSIQKDKITNALLKIEALSMDIQESLDNGSIDTTTGSSFLTTLDILRITL